VWLSREAALYYVEYNRSFKSGAITHSWGFLCEKHLEEKRLWVLEDSTHRAMRWLPVEEVPLRKFAYQVAPSDRRAEFWKASYWASDPCSTWTCGKSSAVTGAFQNGMRSGITTLWKAAFAIRTQRWITLAQILDEEHLPAAVIAYLRYTLLIPAAI
jgi:hypothetical protein